jgi:small subunit ribosomal protein S6
MQRTYEIMFIVRPDLADEDVDRLVSTMETNITSAGGVITGTQRMGKRRMAYSVRKFNDGNYILLNVEGAGGVVKEAERRLRVAEQVIKFITVRTDEEGKRLEKIRQIRESHRKGQGRQAAEAAGETGAGTEPASLEA